MSQGTFSDLLIRLEAIKEIFVFGPKIDFLPRVSPLFWVKNDQILRWTFSLLYVSRNLGVS